MRIRNILFVILGLLCALPTLAVVATLDAPVEKKAAVGVVPEQEMMIIGQSDLIVVGTVTAVSDAGATLKVDRLLLGPKVDTINLSLPYVVAAPVAGAPTRIGAKVDLKQRSLFFLQRSGLNYTLVWGQNGIKSADDADKFATAIAQYPVEVTFGAPLAISAFGQPVAVTLKVTNKLGQKIKVNNFTVSGFFYSPKFTSSALWFQEVHPDAAKTPPTTLEVEAGQEASVTLQMVTPRPQAMDLISPDTYVLTPIGVRALLNIALEDGQTSFNAVSPCQNTLIGFPLPEELAPKKAATSPTAPGKA